VFEQQNFYVFHFGNKPQKDKNIHKYVIFAVGFKFISITTNTTKNYVMKRGLFFIFAAFIVSAGMLTSCQQDELAQVDSVVSLKSAGGGDCAVDCIKSDGVSAVKTYSVSFPGNIGTVTVKIKNSANELHYEITSTLDLAAITYNGEPWGDLDANTPTVYPISIGDFGDDWEACDLWQANFLFERRVPGGGQGVQQPLSTEYALIGVCDDDDDDDDPEPCELRYETAFGGELTGSGRSWWFYYNGVGTQKIYAGQHEEIGTVQIVGGQMQISLTGGWALKDGATESVKVQGYNGSVPSTRPAAGRFTTYKGSSYQFYIDSFDYYVIHLDVEICE
jgi:hypothetical protein